MVSAIHIVSLSHFNALTVGIALGIQLLKFMVEAVIYEQSNVIHEKPKQ